jgi:hypothetical protein
MFNDSESAESWLARAALLKEKHSNGNGAGMPLAVAVKIADWPTPRASENENRQTKATPSQLAGEHGWSLGAAVNHWPTPNASPLTSSMTLTCSGDGRTTPNKLGWSVAIEPTEAFVPACGAALSPAWVCRLMGFPDGWTITSGPPAVAKRSTPASLRARRRASQ